MNFLRIIGFVWLFPATLLTWLLYILPAWLFGVILYKGMHSFLVWKFQLVNSDSWYARAWSDWYGWSGPCVMIVKDLPGERDDRWVKITEVHEGRHCAQQFVLGIFFYPAYIAHSMWLWLFRKDKHSYLDNWFERDARRAAGQRIDIGPEQWPHGPRDRWAWWILLFGITTKVLETIWNLDLLTGI